jgi:adenosylcobinamide-phosphate synthase
MTITDIYPVLRIPLAFGLDALLGEPSWLVHPVRIMGKIISSSEKFLRALFPKTPQGERAAGIVMVVMTCFFSYAVPFCILYALHRLARHFYVPAITYAACALDIFWGYQSIAARGLSNESMSVFKSLSVSVASARQSLSRIVGRETKNLDSDGIIRAAVETVSENTTDGVVSPLIYFAIGGAPLALLYKAINTMDSMVGYMNDKYRNFGRCAAKLDDAVNFIPARISAVLMILSSLICKSSSKFPVRFTALAALKVFLRDRKKHASPNSAQTESACAGALGITLGGDAVYDGIVEHHQTIGDPVKSPDSIDIERSVMLMYVTSSLAAILCMLVRLVIAVHL